MMAERDQQMRIRNSWDPNLDRRNAERLKEIVADIGWPTISKVGANASQCAWLLVQHADHDIDFQRHCLRLMHEAGSDVSSQDVAYLEDRVRIKEGRPQLYATQIAFDESGELVQPTIEDPDGVDSRRKRIGLEPLAEYMANLKRMWPGS
jgi:hypothetical protein